MAVAGARAPSRLAHDTPHFSALPPLSLYVHVPWCVKKCPYCDFNSHEMRGGEPPLARYVEALIADLDHTLPKVWGRRVSSIFFGGGTPSLLPGEAVDEILAAVRARITVQPDAEITLEANPGTVDAARFRAFRQAGVNRLSIGVQSFNDAHLTALGRIHDAAAARAAIAAARAAFDNFNLDLMYGLPQQDVAQAVADVEAALAFEPPHLSVYHLTLEPNTLFQRQPPVLPDDDTAAAMQTALDVLLARQGYTNYETSAYARAGARCVHNLNYWTFGDYIGIGAGAHAKISFPGRVTREARYRQPRQYMDAALQGGAPETPGLLGTNGAIQTFTEVRGADLGFEFMMNALRLADGFETQLFVERTGLPLTVVLKPLEIAESRGLISRDHRRIAPTALGRQFLNDLLQIFLPPST